MKKFLISEVILLFGILIHANAQESKVSGRVSAAKEGIALPGVSVQIKNATKGTMTDADGNYSLTLNSDTDTLIFSFIGYATKQEAVNRRNQVNVQLESETTELKEVVITGFQEVERKLFTGSSTTVKMSDIKMSGITDASQMLEGRVAGVTVDNVSGTFGTSPKIRIRGNTSINGNTQPLMVVDGVILEDLSATTASDILTGNANTLTASSIAGLNPDDILSQNILKDASATALYGTRAKNGVIVITTKKGRAGETRINYSGNFSIHLRPSEG